MSTPPNTSCDLPSITPISRLFSISRKLSKALKWKLNGTTENVDWVRGLLEAAVDHLPELKDQVDSAVVKSGNPPLTGNDPLHASGVIGKGSLKHRNRLTSYHAYPDGTVTFSNKKLPKLKVTATGVQTFSSAEASSSASTATTQQQPVGQRPAEQSTPSGNLPAGWAFDDSTQSYKYWDGAKWGTGQYSASARSWVRWDGAKWVKYD